MNRLRNMDGFTLMETLISLSILLLLLVITAPFIFQQFDRFQVKQFLHLFESDVLFAQNNAIGGVGRTSVYFDQEYYIVLDGQYKLIERTYPKDVSVRATTRRITFNASGNIIDPKTINIDHLEKRYQIVFPFGKGRFYVKE